MDDRVHAVVMPTEGRRRVVVEDVEPKVDCGRFPVKHILGDIVTVTAAVYGDGHDHVAARVLYKREDQIEWRNVTMEFLGNDLWHGNFIVDEIGLWQFRVEGWIDHFDTWADDFAKRLTAHIDRQYGDKCGKSLFNLGKISVAIINALCLDCRKLRERDENLVNAIGNLLLVRGSESCHIERLLLNFSLTRAA